jgi:hypothetical protein
MSFSGEYRAPRFRDIGLALLIAVIALVALLQLGDVVKLAGSVFYWLPARLGLLRQADASEVWRYDLRTMPEVISLPAAGRYMIYTADYDLLTVTAALAEKDARPWLTISDANTGQELPARYVDRGMRLYDSHLAPGRPVFSVEIPQAGFYAVKGPRRPVGIAIARDYVTGNERRIAVVFAAELALLAAPFALFYGRPYLRRRRSLRAMQRARRAEADAAFQRIQEKRTAPPEDGDPHAAYRPKN